MSGSEERGFLDAISTEYAWSVTADLVRGGRIVGGTPKSRLTAEWIREQMVRNAGLDRVDIESFPVVGYDVDEAEAGESVGVTQLSIARLGIWEPVAAVQAMKGRGTGAAGVTGEIVDVGVGRLEDFERVDVRDRIVLFTATDLLFYGAPVQVTARRRGAVGAIMHWPAAPGDALRLHTMAGYLPLVSVRNADAARIRRLLPDGSVEARIVIDNRWDDAPIRVGSNVVGVQRGIDHPDEFVYLCAHFDHWFTSAADNNAGVGSLLAIAKAIRDGGVRPRRTLVFAAFDAEELGGWADTWYDWLIGSYSHIVETLTGPPLHPDHRGRIVAMLNMDVVGTRVAEALIESTPELCAFLRRAADDSGLASAVPTKVYWPPTSYDDWPFYQAGAPVSQIAWWGPAYEPLYHTTADTMETLDPENVRLNMAFNGLALLRASQERLHPYDLRETVRATRRGLDLIRSKAPDLARGLEVTALEEASRLLHGEVARVGSLASDSGNNPDSLNRAMREAIALLNPKLFVWDFTAPLPGWAAVPNAANPASDWDCLQMAVDALRRGSGVDARDHLARIATMQWGRFMDSDGYRIMLEYLAPGPAGRMMWGRGFIPPLTDVQQEYGSIGEKMLSADRDFGPEIVSLRRKADSIRSRFESDLSAVAGAVRSATKRLSSLRPTQ